MEKRKYEGLDVPVEPKLDWYWLSDTSAGCEVGEGDGILDCAYTYCHKCIYSRYNADKRKDFYKEFIDNTSAIGQSELLSKTCASLAIKTTEVLNKELEKKQEDNMNNTDIVESLKKDLLKYLEDKGYWPGCIYLTADNVERCREAIGTFLSTKDLDRTYNVKVDYWADTGIMNMFITGNIEEKDNTAEDNNRKKSETAKPKVYEYFRNLVIPKEPERTWTWMLTNSYCPICGTYCIETSCRDCIYSRYNADNRKAFYESKFKEEETFEVGDIVEYTVEYHTSVGIKKVTVTSPILAVKKVDGKSYLVYWYDSDQTRYLDLSQYKVKLIKKAK